MQSNRLRRSKSSKEEKMNITPKPQPEHQHYLIKPELPNEIFEALLDMKKDRTLEYYHSGEWYLFRECNEKGVLCKPVLIAKLIGIMP